MRKPFEFSKARPNPYGRLLKKQITLRLDEPTVEYFKGLAQEAAIPHQTLINLHLRECAASRKKLHLTWQPAKKPGAA